MTSLAESGKKKIEWVKKHMKVLNYLKNLYQTEKPFEGINVAISIHLEAKTAYLGIVLHELGANVAITGSNPLSTQEDVVEALKEYGLNVHAERTLDESVYWKNIDKILETNPNIILDDGADLGITLIEKHPEKVKNLWGICEETTTGVKRYKSLFKENKLPVPVILINDSYMKYLFDNRYGTGQSTWDGIMRSTNLSVAGKVAVVAGYGWCGKGVAMRAKGLGANVIITEVDPIKANEAIMDGFKVMKMDEAVKYGDFFVTVTGDIDVITKRQFLEMKDGAILSNSGHFDVEVKVKDLEEIAVEKINVRNGVEEYKLPNGKSVFLLGQGRLVNLVNGDGHPAEIMDLSFSLQLEGAKFIKENHQNMKVNLSPVPYEIDEKIAQIKLKTLGIEIDTLTEEQQDYLNSWK
ncbi:S-adenosyl-L-homocysteine hydrolase [Petrotoga sp. HWH.PT.55.6.1]|uniref:adenosylhomocysteinase n=1 Tax=unclassified Petrotoga TaxID=2620614 RepID=UPI000CA03774|nr:MULTISPECIES: adenosylhomocysteinase [unclassified Petrotoga]PNR94367.1 S-adenosyl-L-homocysteine hydrolase [Petrotoga sp. HWHPT.55.6.3]RPD35329.1 S-adenosyl-L-homocysteine hydrolase [Petrotoga sp. HWH.PT.55.6.1]